MKRLLFTCFFATVLSLAFGNYIFSSYKSAAERIISSSLQSEKVYMMLYGSYNNKEKINKLSLDNYILIEEDGFYKVYVGISTSLENSNKIKEIYKELGNSIYIRENSISNLEFIDYLYNKEQNFNELTKEEILSIENDIINKYKEIFNE